MNNWKLIANGNYKISDAGEIRRVTPAHGTHPGKLIRPNVSGKLRYPAVTLAIDTNRPKRFPVHILVATAFLGPCPPGHEVNHKDGNKMDYRLSNLEYLTYSANKQHAFQLGLSKKGQESVLCLYDDAVLREIRAAYMAGLKRGQLMERYGISKSHLYRVLHQGYRA